MNTCADCDKETSNPRFCSRTCSTRYWNRARPKRKRKPGPPCGFCGGTTKRSDRRYCSLSCANAGKARDRDASSASDAPEGFRTCDTCHESKSPESFSKRGKTGRQRRCKPCQKDYYDEWQRRKSANAQVVRRTRWKAERVARNREFLADYLRSHPCTDCGFTDIRVLDFDHVTGEKRAGVFELAIRGASLDEIQLEMAKCEVRCLNCHRIVTAQRGGWWTAGLALVPAP